MIYYRIPWSDNKNLSDAYNREMALLPNDEDYCCFIDRDAMFLHPFFGKQIGHIVSQTNHDLYTCMTNRVNCKEQLHDYPHNWHSNDIEYHTHVARKLHDEHCYDIQDITNISPPISGVVILLRKEAWKRIGGFKGDGMLGVDNRLHLDVAANGGKVILMRGVYVYHYYRNGNRKQISHLL